TKLNTKYNKNIVIDALEWLNKNAYGKEPVNNLEELKTNFSKSAPQMNTNLYWWDYEIGTHRALTNTLLLLKEDFTDE
ncbi:hypothetical protein Q0P64_14195, partial [Staphylococcus aureus]|nr:hypothetical protein [Staphylococcus aureus]